MRKGRNSSSARHQSSRPVSCVAGISVVKVSANRSQSTSSRCSHKLSRVADRFVLAARPHAVRTCAVLEESRYVTHSELEMRVQRNLQINIPKE
jgi:hypothetical protein